MPPAEPVAEFDMAMMGGCPVCAAHHFKLHRRTSGTNTQEWGKRGKATVINAPTEERGCPEVLAGT